MSKLLQILVLCVASLFVFSHMAHAAPKQPAYIPTYIWHGPGCGDGFTVCSIDPPSGIAGVTEDYTTACYKSRHPDYTPSRLEMSMIDVCQAAKGAAIAPQADRVQALNNFARKDEILYYILLDKPSDLDLYSAPLEALENDVSNFSNDEKIYALMPTEDNWDQIVNDLGLIAIDAQVTGTPY